MVTPIEMMRPVSYSRQYKSIYEQYEMVSMSHETCPIPLEIIHSEQMVAV